MTEETNKKSRECGYCHQVAGHNARSCPKKKEDEAAGISVASAPKKGMPKKKAAGAKKPSTPATVLAASSGPSHIEGSTDASDFEEISKYANVNGKTLACKLREYANGNTQVAMMITEGEETKAFPLLDVEVAGRFLELLGGIIQRHAARPQAAKGPIVRGHLHGHTNGRALSNGSSTKSTPAEA